jgi:uncharacterized RDD family membrane protein YckC
MDPSPTPTDYVITTGSNGVTTFNFHTEARSVVPSVGSFIIGNLASLFIIVVMAALVWNHYSGAKYPLEKRYSTFWPRFWEGSADALIFWPLTVLTTALGLYWRTPAMVVGTLLVQNGAQWIYSVWMHGKYGQTVGKMVCKVRILDAKTEKPITYWQAFLRDAVPIAFTVAYLPSQIRTVLHPVAKGVTKPDMLFVSIFMIWFIIEVVTMLTNDKRQALHDFIAGTVVVRTTAGETKDGLLVGPADVGVGAF